MADTPRREPPSVDTESPHDSGARGDEAARQIAHEINNPLTVVMSNVALIEEATARLERDYETHIPPAQRALIRRSLADVRAPLNDLRAAAERIGEVAQKLAHAQIPANIDATAVSKAPDRARILVIDDNASVARTLARVLREHDVVVAVRAVEAIDRVAAGERFDVIVCDIMMPLMSGSQVHEKLSEIAPEQAKRMVYITGGPTTENETQFLARVGQPVLAKPFSPNELRMLVQSLLR